MGSCDDAKALAEGQRAAGSATPEWGRATTQKLWPKANAQLGARPQNGVVRRRKRIRRIRPLAAAGLGANSARSGVGAGHQENQAQVGQ